MGPKNHVLDGSPSPHTRRGNFEDEKMPAQCMFGGQCTQSDSAGGRNGTVWLMIGCTRWGAHWQIQLNRPCVAAMCPHDREPCKNCCVDQNAIWVYAHRTMY